MLFLRTVDANYRSYGGFQWPREVGAIVSAPDWDPAPKCGGGLHGLLWGEGCGNMLYIKGGYVALVVEADESVDLCGKHKFPTCTIKFVGDLPGAAAYIIANGGVGRAVAFAVVSAGDCGTATAGYRGTATAGVRGAATAGDGGLATAGYRGTATTGCSGTATAGDHGTATAGDGGTATAGYRGTASAGDHGTAKAGYRGIIQITYSDGARRRVMTGYVGEDGIEPNVLYRVQNWRFVKA